jgi:predicted nucleic acid-binding protein
VIVYVESNFLLEIALGRESEAAAREILDRAEQRDLDLAVPSFALCEPFSTLSYRARKRSQDLRPMRQQLEDLGRGDVYRDLIDAVAPRLADVLDVEIRERTVLEEVVGRLLGCATILQLSDVVFFASQTHQRTHGLDAADAIIYASVLEDAGSQPRDAQKIFITRNSKDFERDAIRAELAATGCALAFSFENA